MPTESMTYAGVGVDYDAMDPFKRAAQLVARETAGNILRLNNAEFRELEASRGESVYLIEAAKSYIAHVEEGLGTKSLVGDAMYHLTGVSYYEHVALDAVAMIVNDMITLGALPLTVAMHLAVGAQAGPPIAPPDELERGGRPEHHHTQPVLGLGHRCHGGQGAGNSPAPAASGQERAKERQTADGVDLTPVRSRHDRCGHERPQARAEHRVSSSGATPQQPRRDHGDGDIRRDGDGLDGDAQRLTVQQRAQAPKHVRKPGWIPAGEVPGLVEPRRPDRRETLGPGDPNRDVAGETRGG